jgi:oxalyl-CoA decarboxylase
MQIETICRYKLPIVVIVFNNGSVNRGDDEQLTRVIPSLRCLREALRQTQQSIPRHGIPCGELGLVGNRCPTPRRRTLALVSCVIDLRLAPRAAT